MAVVFVVVLPGSLAYRLTGAKHQSLRARLIVQFALGFTILPVVGMVLSRLGRIDSPSLLVSYGIIGIAWAAILRMNQPDSHILSGLKILQEVPSARRLFITLLPLVIGLAVWFPYLGAHTADAGLHTFWGKWTISTGRLPDYSVVGPSSPQEIHVYGAHLFLAVISLLSQVPINDFFWVPLLLLYSLILLAVQTITLQLSKSRVASTVASLFYVTSQIPAARILLGNLPDLIGYFLIAALVLSLVTSQNRRSLLTLSLVGPAIIVYYQYALLTETLLLLFSVGLVGIYLARFHRIHVFRPSLSSLRRHAWILAPITLAIAESLLLATHVSYLSGRSVQILQATKWIPVAGSDYALSLGNPNILYLGFLGMAVELMRRFGRNAPGPVGGFAVAGWISALVAASNGPRVGVGVEPIRFVWRLVEPLSIMSGIMVVLIMQYFCGKNSRTLTLGGVMFKLSFSSDRARLRAAALLLSILAIIFIISPFQASWPGWQHFSQPFYQDDVAIGQWLASNTAVDDGVAVNNDFDSTATWIQASSLRPRFFYKADYAVNVSAPPFSYVYRDMAMLFKNPGSPDALTIVHKYNISYVVVHRPDYPAFYRANEYFLQVYASPNGNATIFKPTS